MDRLNRTIAWFVRNPRTGQPAMAATPNPAILLWLATVAYRALADPSADADEKVSWIGTGALLAWALDELFRGCSPFRRVLGAGVLAWQAASLTLQ